MSSDSIRKWSPNSRLPSAGGLGRKPTILPSAYERFPKPEFDDWIGGLKDKIREGLTGVPPPPPPSLKRVTYSPNLVQSHPYEGKGKGRDLRDGPGFSTPAWRVVANESV